MCGENKPNINFQDCIEIGNASQSGQKILITSYVFDALSSPDNLNHEEYTKCLLLLGVFEGENGIIILDTIPFNLSIDDNGQYKLSKKKYRSLCSKAHNQFPDLQIVGWCTISNPSECDLLPSYAVAIHRKFFRCFRETLLLIDPVSSQFSIYEWSGINLKPSTGYYYHTDNNDPPKLIFKMKEIENKIPALAVSINENSVKLPEKLIEINSDINIRDNNFADENNNQIKYKKNKFPLILSLTIVLVLVIVSISIILSIIN